MECGVALGSEDVGRQHFGRQCESSFPLFRFELRRRFSRESQNEIDEHDESAAM